MIVVVCGMNVVAILAAIHGTAPKGRLIPPEVSMTEHCRTCIGGKLKNVPRAHGTREWSPLQCLHADLSFPGVDRFEKSRCLLTVKDGATR
jgi:hypothetical protein